MCSTQYYAIITQTSILLCSLAAEPHRHTVRVTQFSL